jgi:hypothetical protein
MIGYFFGGRRYHYLAGELRHPNTNKMNRLVLSLDNKLHNVKIVRRWLKISQEWFGGRLCSGLD